MMWLCGEVIDDNYQAIKIFHLTTTQTKLSLSQLT